MISTDVQPALELVRFSITCADADDIFVFLTDQHDRSQMLQMTCVGPDRWQLQIDLEPGEYSYHYYLRVGNVLVYQAPRGIHAPARLRARLVVTATQREIAA